MAIRILEIHTLPPTVPVHASQDANTLLLQMRVPSSHVLRIVHRETEMLFEMVSSVLSAATVTAVIFRQKRGNDPLARSVTRDDALRSTNVQGCRTQLEEEEGC